MKITVLGHAALVALVVASAPSLAADKVKIGLLTTLSGQNAAPGIEIRDGFNLALKLANGKFGGLPVEVIQADDQLNPEIAKQAMDRMTKRDRVDFLTGIVYSNVLLAVAPLAIESKTFYISPNAGPSQLAGEGCSPYFFAASWQNDTIHEAPGKFALDRGMKNVYLLSANYAAGKDAMSGFRRYYTPKPVDEVYVKLGQLDYSAEIAQIRAAKPEAVYFFLPGGMGINFVKQFVAAGLSKDIRLIATGITADEDVIRATGDSMIGLFNASPWSADLDNAANKTFVAAFEREYNRLPTAYAAQSYDTALMIDAAVRDVKGKVEDKDALLKALRATRFKSVRGDFKLNNNQFPIQNYYLRVIGKDAQGRVTNKTLGTVFTNHGDSFAKQCKMKF
ncbi:MAG: ABC transporter substrate-binding protein [Burkholderiales bacterium]